jgi:predicted nucleic acid-binding protein
MTFDQIPVGTDVFLDANTLIYHFTAEPSFGAACTRLVERIEQGDLRGFTSADVLSDTAHRMMTIEAMQCFGWPMTGLAARLRKQHAEIAKLDQFRQAIEKVPQLRIQVWNTTLDLVLSAAKLSRQHGLLSADALILAAMQFHGLTTIATHDADFDRVPGLKRYAPV